MRLSVRKVRYEHHKNSTLAIKMQLRQKCLLPSTEYSSAAPQDHKTNNSTASSAPAGRSGERRISLYDVLTGDAPLPPRVERGVTAAAEAGAGRASGTHPPLGGARRASIFDRIADVVFNEEQKEENPVDAVAVR